MGYNSTFSLKWKPLTGAKTRYYSCEHIGFQDVVRAKFCSECGEPVMDVTLDQKIAAVIIKGQNKDEQWLYGILPTGESSDGCKWYNAEEEIKGLSAMFPDTLFTLHQQGEDGQQWRKYFLNNQCQVELGVVTFGEFDPKKLKGNKVDKDHGIGMVHYHATILSKS